MIYKLHLTREELDFLSVAVEERQRIITYFLAHDQGISLDQIPFDPDPLNDSERENMTSALERSAVLAEKIHLLSSYVILNQDTAKARDKANAQKKIYLDYIKGIRPETETFPDNQDLEIPEI